MIAIRKEQLYSQLNHDQVEETRAKGSRSPDPLAEIIVYLNSHLKTTDEVLLWARDHFPKGKLIQVTSFGPSGMVILHKMQKLGILADVPTASIDTLHLFPETYDLTKSVQERYGDMELRVFRPNGLDSMESFDERYGADLWRDDPDRYADLAKVEPMDRAMAELEPMAWITGRRSSQGNERTELRIFEIDGDYNRIKINPLAHWTYNEVWTYIRTNDIPYNPLHDKGYKSIGDVMTTRPVAEDADERSGRFVGMGKTECGLHSRNRPKKSLRGKKKNKQIAIEVAA